MTVNSPAGVNVMRIATGGAEVLVGVRFGKALADWLRDKAHVERKSVAELVRQAVVSHFRHEPGFPNPAEPPRQ